MPIVSTFNVSVEAKMLIESVVNLGLGELVEAMEVVSLEMISDAVVSLLVE